jgi:hypothetical protein
VGQIQFSAVVDSTLVIDAGAVANGLVPAGTPATIRGLGGHDDGARDRAFGQNDRTLSSFSELK